jgi:hypothetical protein
MLDNNERYKLQFLHWAGETAIRRTFSNHIEAKKLVAGWIAQDRRFDGLDPVKLAERVDQYQSNRAQIDLDDPRLRGLPPRPLERDRSW